MATSTGRPAAMNVVASDVQRIAALTDDRVPLFLANEAQRDGETRLDNASRMAEQSALSQLHNMHQNITLTAAMNESANANNFIYGVAEERSTTIRRSTKDVTREQSLVSRKLLHNVYIKDHYTYGTILLQATTALVVVIMLVGAIWSMDRLDAVSAVVVSVAAFAAYIAVVIVTMAYLGKRRKEGGRTLAWRVSAQMDADMSRLFAGNSSCS
jgi:hypothetical protein